MQSAGRRSHAEHPNSAPSTPADHAANWGHPNAANDPTQPQTDMSKELATDGTGWEPSLAIDNNSTTICKSGIPTMGQNTERYSSNNQQQSSQFERHGDSILKYDTQTMYNCIKESLEFSRHPRSHIWRKEGAIPQISLPHVQLRKSHRDNSTVVDRMQRRLPREGANIQIRREAAGTAAETFMYLYLKQHLPSSCQIDWVSRTGAQYLGNPTAGRDDLGYDIEMYDAAGDFDPVMGATHYFIEVKSCSTSSTNHLVFHMSKNEFETASLSVEGHLDTDRPKLRQQFVFALVGDSLSANAECLVMLMKPLKEMVASAELQLEPVEFKVAIPLPSIK